jgi:hypothetical protein
MATVDVTALADAVRETGIGLKPGDVLAVRLPMEINQAELRHARTYADAVGRDAGITVALIPGEEFAHTTVNVNVTVNGTDPETLAGEVRRQVLERAPAGPLA